MFGYLFAVTMAAITVALATGAIGLLDRDSVRRAESRRLLLDAKAPPGAALPGGNGVTFDWDLLAGAALPPGTMLSGGLGPGNVAGAMARTGLSAVDVSSGVEGAPGVKDPLRIAAFARALGLPA